MITLGHWEVEGLTMSLMTLGPVGDRGSDDKWRSLRSSTDCERSSLAAEWLATPLASKTIVGSSLRGNISDQVTASVFEEKECPPCLSSSLMRNSE